MDVWFLSALHDSINNWLSKFVYGCRAKDGNRSGVARVTSVQHPFIWPDLQDLNSAARSSHMKYAGLVSDGTQSDIQWICIEEAWSKFQAEVLMRMCTNTYTSILQFAVLVQARRHTSEVIRWSKLERARERESKFVVKMSIMIARIGLTSYLKNSLIFLSQKHLGWESWLFSLFLHLNFRTGFSHGEFLSFFAWHPLLAPRRPQRHHVGLAHYDATPPTPKPLDSFVEGFLDGSQSKLLPSLNFKDF